jgi:hypothetical protein
MRCTGSAAQCGSPHLAKEVITRTKIGSTDETCDNFAFAQIDDSPDSRAGSFCRRFQMIKSRRPHLCPLLTLFACRLGRAH